jgi:hypothetical protein
LFGGLFNRLGKKNPAGNAPTSPLRNDRKSNILTKKNYAKLEDFMTQGDYPADINSEFNNVIRVGNNLIDPPRVTSKTEIKGDVMTRLELLCGREEKIRHLFFPDGDEAKRLELLKTITAVATPKDGPRRYKFLRKQKKNYQNRKSVPPSVSSRQDSSSSSSNSDKDADKISK